MSGYVVNIEHMSRANTDFRHVLSTAPHSQLVVMTLQAGEDIGMETHPTIDQFIRIEAGQGEAILDGERHALRAGVAVVIPAGTAHNIINTSATEPMHLSTVYSPPNHPDGTVNRTKQEAEAYERARHG